VSGDFLQRPAQFIIQLQRYNSDAHCARLSYNLLTD
jgi:hypothetical protein